MKHFLNQLVKYWDHFWFRRFDPLPVSLFRICLGALIFIMFVANWPNWERFYGADGIPSLHHLGFNRPGDDWWSIFYWTDSIIPIRVYWWVGLMSTIAFTIGLGTRLATITLYILQTSMIHRNLWLVNGEDLVFRMVLLYSIFAPLNYSLSIDSWLRKKPPPMPRIWPVRLMQINIALIYLISLPYKLVDDIAWINGDAIYWTVTSNMWSRWPWPELFYASDGILSKLATYGTVLIEGLFPVLVWFPQTNLYAVAAIAGLHIGIALLIPNVAFFTLAMVCSFWVFVPATTVRQLTRRVFNMHLG